MSHSHKPRSSSLYLLLFSLLLPTALLSSCDNAIGERFYLENGQQYIANGYLDVSDDGFSINQDFMIDFGRMVFKESFNRIHINYSSDKPLHVSLNYRIGLLGEVDDFYLEAGNHVSFDGLIAAYTDNKYANTLHHLSISTCDGSTANIGIHDVAVEHIPTLDDDIYYLENSHYKVGINLKWGGGISYIKDKENTQDGLDNLINSHDTGRLIQQSYYGTRGNDFYQPGISFYQSWFYNPVQGGDQYGHPSRLIDYRIDENNIYIKSQPQDWSKDNCLTPSYMENTYILSSDDLRVDNSFIDYSGYDHPRYGQELPAFYTVSYLDTFVFYNGKNGWQDDTLTFESDLPFWGPYKEECTFTFDDTNTERWCAWVSSETNYGIGLYTPNVTSVCAGRFEYNGSKDPNDNSTNYVSPGSEFKIISYQKVSYSYMITCGSVAGIRSTFKANKDFVSNSGLDAFAID